MEGYEPVIILLASVLAFSIIGVPIVWSLGLSSLLGIWADGDTSIMVMSQRMYTGASKYALLAIFFYILAGSIMQNGGISRRLVDFSNAMFGHIRGGLSIVCIVTCVFFGAISGSGIATTLAIGGILFPSLVKAGYDRDYAAAVPAAAGMLGTVIPPSISFVVYGTVTNTSISSLLIAGIVPGVLTGFALCIYAFVYASAKKFPKNQHFSFIGLLKATWAAGLSLLMPVIILGGIYLGVFTPTESASVAVAYGLVVSLVFYREMGLKTLKAVALDSVKGTASIMLLVMSATIFSWFLTIYDIPILLGEFVQSLISTRTMFLITINILLLLLGMFMENGAIILILAPLIAPVATRSYGIDPVHFGLIMVFNLALGQATPPFGTCLFAAASMSGQGIVGIAKKVIPLCLVIFAVVVLISFTPRLALWLPSIMVR